MNPEQEVAELDAALAPIAGESPTGVDLRQDYSPNSLYFRLRDARAAARDAERQADTEGSDEGLSSHWRPVASLAREALSGATKDIEVAAWLTEALVRIAGLPGLSLGAAVIAGLAERYWDDVFPMPDEDGMETRVGPLGGLSGQGYDGTLMQPLRKLALFARADGSPFSLWQYEASLELSGISDPTRRAQRIEAGVLPFEDVEQEARRAGSGYWATQRHEVSRAMAAWAEMSRVLDEKANDVSPSFTRVRDLLQLLLDTCNRFAPDAGVATDIAMAAPSAGPNQATSMAVAPGAVTAGGIAGREQALSQLAEIAAWFKRNEPQSPIAYTLDEAVRRGRMSWPDLLDEVMSDETARNALLSSLGIKPKGYGE